MKVPAQNATTVRIEMSPRSMAWILAAGATLGLFAISALAIEPPTEPEPEPAQRELVAATGEVH